MASCHNSFRDSQLTKFNNQATLPDKKEVQQLLTFVHLTSWFIDHY